MSKKSWEELKKLKKENKKLKNEILDLKERIDYLKRLLHSMEDNYHNNLKHTQNEVDELRKLYVKDKAKDPMAFYSDLIKYLGD